MSGSMAGIGVGTGLITGGESVLGAIAYDLFNGSGDLKDHISNSNQSWNSI